MTEYLKKEHFLEYVSSSCLDLDKKIYCFETKTEKIIVIREGLCDYKKCKSACCKFIDSCYIKDYSRGFFDDGDEYGNYWTNIKCRNLSRCGTCKLWNKKLPVACKQFPHPNDSTYWKVIDKCSFKFVILKTFSKTEKLIREEMIQGFIKQND